MKNLFFILISSIFFASCNKETVYYVSSLGNDNNSGSKQQPFATIAQAQKVARQTKGAVSVYLREGTWGGHLLEYKDVFNTVLETGDHGAFNSWGRDRYWYPRTSMVNNSLHPHVWL